MSGEPGLNEPIRLGFIGGGINSAVGYTHYVASRMDGHFEVVAGCFSRDAQTNRQSAERMHIAADRRYESIEDLLSAEQGRLDAVCVLTPTPLHFDNVMGAVELGHNVICEKALAVSVKQGAEMVGALHKTGQFCGVTFNYAGYPMVREARAMIQQGVLGRLNHVICEMPQETFSRADSQPQPWRQRDYEIPCVSLDLGVHVHHLVRYVTGDPVLRNVSARHATHGRLKDVFDTVTLTAEYEDDLLVNMLWGKAFLGERNGLNIRILGDQGSLCWRQTDPEILLFAAADGSVTQLDRGLTHQMLTDDAKQGRFKAGHPAGFIEALPNLYNDFGACLRGDERKRNHVEAYFSAASALSGLEFLEALQGEFCS